MPSARRHHQPIESRTHAPRPVSSGAVIVGASVVTDEAWAPRSCPLALGSVASGAPVGGRLGVADGVVSPAD